MSFLRFLPGILILQLATAALVYAGLAADSERIWLPLVALGLTVSGFAALWFGALAEHLRKDALARVTEKWAREREALNQAFARERESLSTGFAREREALRVTAESEKLAALEATHQRILRETRQAETRANFKLGLGLLGLLGLGGMLLAVEFMTLGLLIFAATGGAVGGYLTRVRHERRLLRRGGVAEALPAVPPKTVRAERLDPPSGKIRLFGKRER